MKQSHLFTLFLLSAAALGTKGRGQSIVGTSGNDVLSGTSGSESIAGLGGDDVIFCNGGDDNGFGDDGNDQIHGDDGNDVCDGGTGDDVLDGGNGNDILAGGDGSDTLIGGPGIDTFFDNNWGNPYYADDDLDTIDATDGQGGEHIFAGANDDIRADPDDIVHIYAPGSCYPIFEGTFADWQAAPPIQMRALAALLLWANGNGIAMADAEAFLRALSGELDLSFHEIWSSVQSLIQEGWTFDQIMQAMLEAMS